MIQDKNTSNIRALEEASLWVAREGSGEMTRAEQGELDVWLDINIEHKQAYRAIRNTSDLLGSISNEDGRRAFAAIVPEMEDLFDECDDLSTLLHRERRPVRTYRWIAAVAASLLLVVVSTILIFQDGPTATTYATEIGGLRTVMLKDGSIITLNTDTQISVALSNSERRILLKHGEAYFDVAKNKTRPFIVVVGKDVVRAVGTAFNIKRRAEVTKVTVMEGTVEVKTKVSSNTSDQRHHPSLIVPLEVGGDLTLSLGEIHKTQLKPSEIEHTASWRTGMIHFDGEKLGAIVEELQYYATKEIIFANDEVRNIIVGGSFDTTNVSSFLKGLELAFPISVIERDMVIVLSYATKNANIISAYK